MNDYGNRESERGNIEPRRGRQGIGNLWDWEPLRGFFPGNWNQMLGVEVNHRDGGYEIEIPVPGFKPADIDVTYQEGIITVNGKNERRTFTRSLTVPEDIDEESISANVEHGILTLKMRVHPQRQPRRINISTQSSAGGPGGGSSSQSTTGNGGSTQQTIDGQQSSQRTS